MPPSIGELMNQYSSRLLRSTFLSPQRQILHEFYRRLSLPKCSAFVDYGCWNLCRFLVVAPSRSQGLISISATSNPISVSDTFDDNPAWVEEG